MKRGDTFDIPTSDGPVKVTALPMRYATFGAAQEARRAFSARGVTCILDFYESDVCVFVPVPVWEKFGAVTERMKRVPKSGVRLERIVERTVTL